MLLNSTGMAEFKGDKQFRSDHEEFDKDVSGTLVGRFSTRYNLPISINELTSRIRSQILMLGNPGDEASIGRVFKAHLIAFRRNGEPEEAVLANISFFLESKIIAKQQTP